MTEPARTISLICFPCPAFKQYLTYSHKGFPPQNTGKPASIPDDDPLVSLTHDRVLGLPRDADKEEGEPLKVVEWLMDFL
jgi:hypothetical protein